VRKQIAVVEEWEKASSGRLPTAPEE